MMDLLRSWLTGITAAAILCALADRLMPEGPVRRVGKLAIGLVMLAAVLAPVVRLEAVDPAVFWIESLESGGLQRQELEETRNAVMKDVIEQELDAYIVDKAAELGVVCIAQVSCQAGENGVFLPEQVVLQGIFTPEQAEALAQILETELGIPRDQQRFQTEEEAA